MTLHFLLRYAASISICVLIGVGIGYRRRRNVHITIMLTACALDILLVAWIELARDAVERSFAMGTYPVPGPLLTFHIIVSVLVLVFYGAQITLGTKLYRRLTFKVMAPPGYIARLRAIHRMSGITFIVLRLTNLATSFLIHPQ